MKTILIGQRGTGKTSLLKRLQAEGYGQYHFFDLDEEIEKKLDASITTIFEEKGEEFFRQKEEEVFNDLYKSYEHFFIVLGAGFRFSLPSDANILWIQRAGDLNGRIFLNRPRLNNRLPPLDEYLERAGQREKKFNNLATESFQLTPGFRKELSLGEKMFFLNYSARTDASITVLPQWFDGGVPNKDIFYKIKNWKTRFLELRDDLLTHEQINNLLLWDNEFSFLYSFRNKKHIDEDLSHFHELDWALELGEPQKEVSIVSLHEKTNSIENCFEALEKHTNKHLKLAVEIDSWEELKKGYFWWLKDSRNRSFLPRSSDGRWAWYRQWVGRNQKLNFIRSGIGSAIDQPTLDEWMEGNTVGTRFSAILGNPVVHSMTPTEQALFFKPFPVFRIMVKEEELDDELLSFLKGLGLYAAAVTSPLKEKIYTFLNVREPIAEKLKSVNTLLLSREKVIGTNTDVVGLEALKHSINEKAFSSISVWGGGGTRAPLQSIFPNAVFYSARKGTLIDNKQDINPEPEVIIWGVGRSRQTTCKWPPSEWKPSLVLDLNYSEDSPGLEYAMMVGAEYISGVQMFRLQAQAQREFWSSYEC